jgi:hypothetical protein
MAKDAWSRTLRLAKVCDVAQLATMAPQTTPIKGLIAEQVARLFENSEPSEADHAPADCLSLACSGAVA